MLGEGHELARVIAASLSIGAAIIAGLVVLIVARQFAVRRRYRQRVLHGDLSGTDPLAGEQWSVDVVGNIAVTSGVRTPFGDVLATSIDRVRSNFTTLVGLEARFPPRLTVSRHESVEAFNQDLGLFGVDARRSPCVYTGWQVPRVVLCEPACAR